MFQPFSRRWRSKSTARVQAHGRETVEANPPFEWGKVAILYPNDLETGDGLAVAMTRREVKRMNSDELDGEVQRARARRAMMMRTSGINGSEEDRMMMDRRS
jgi:hypothetical protein